MSKDSQVIVIKKYPNRRLYDTSRSSYVTLSDLSQMVRDGYEFIVKDSKTGDDITRSVLAQIISDQEAHGEGDGTLLPTSFMRQLIGFYGGSMEPVVTDYLEKSMEMFASQQGRMKAHIDKSIDDMGDIPGMKPAQTVLKEISKQNLAIAERTMKIFSSFSSKSNKKDGA